MTTLVVGRISFSEGSRDVRPSLVERLTRIEPKLIERPRREAMADEEKPIDAPEAPPIPTRRTRVILMNSGQIVHETDGDLPSEFGPPQAIVWEPGAAERVFLLMSYVEGVAVYGETTVFHLPVKG